MNYLLHPWKARGAMRRMRSRLQKWGVLNQYITGLCQEHGKHLMTVSWLITDDTLCILMSFLQCQEILMPQPTWSDCFFCSQCSLVQTVLKSQMLDWQHFVCRYHDNRNLLRLSIFAWQAVLHWKHVHRFTRIMHLRWALCQVPVHHNCWQLLLYDYTLLVHALVSHLDLIKYIQ